MGTNPRVPKGWHTVTPRIVAKGARRLVKFLVTVFDAKGEYRDDRPSEIRIGDSIVMITDVGVRRATPAFLYVYVSDADATYRRAIKAGARSLEKPTDTPYGDRRCMVEDRWRNIWRIATRMARGKKVGKGRLEPALKRGTKVPFLEALLEDRGNR